jgi:hypothetical protein
MTVSPLGKVYFSKGTEIVGSLFLVVHEKRTAIIRIKNRENDFFIIRSLRV